MSSLVYLIYIKLIDKKYNICSLVNIYVMYVPCLTRLAFMNLSE